MTQTRNRKEEGAAMLIVMLVLLMTTATAIFAVHATQYEIRGAGAGRQGLQTQYIAEAGAMAAVQKLDDMKPGGMVQLINGTNPPPNFMQAFFEPPLLPGKRDYRMYLSDFTASTPSNWPIETDPTRGSSLGRAGTSLTPNFIVDFNDNRKITAAIAGQRADGFGQLSYLGVTASSHGRTNVTGDYLNATYDTRLYHEGAGDARAFLVAGPASF